MALNETGSSGAFLSPGDGAVFDPSLEQWRKLPHSDLVGLDEASAVWTGKELLVWGSATSSVTNHAAVLVSNR